MNHKLIKTSLLTALVAVASLTSGIINAAEQQVKKPNFLWIVSEDNSKHFINLFNENGAKMPNLEALADQGLIFDNAFSNAPVCSTARTILSTGAYGPKIGTNYHRAAKLVTLPEGLKPIEQLLNEAGYYTTNNDKTDFNFIEADNLWDKDSKKADWRTRQPGQPFFHFQTFKNTHEHKLHFPESDFKNHPLKHDPKSVKLFPVYPDTEVFRYTFARYLDLHLEIDERIGKIVDQLKKDGELENTFIFYMGDHGGALPASKGQIYERGLAVPLVVRIPKNFQYLVNKDMQSPNNLRVDGFVNFVDFAPTLLKLAGLPKPKSYDGEAFLGKDIALSELNKRDTSYGYGDRFDEKTNLVRSVRKGKFKYIRSFEPFYPWGLQADYRYKQKAYQEWRDLYHAGKLNEVQSAFFKPVEVEQLFDIEQDPHETNNLADLPEYQQAKLQLRKNLQQTMLNWLDLSVYPESYLMENALDDIAKFKQDHKADIKNLLAIADLQLQPYQQVKSRLAQILKNGDQFEQYRALVVLSSFGSEANEFIWQANELVKQSNNIYVKSRALEFVTLVSNRDPVADMKTLFSQAKWVELLEVLNIAAFFHENQGIKFDVPEQVYQTVKQYKPKGFRENSIKNNLLSRMNYVSGGQFN